MNPDRDSKYSSHDCCIRQMVIMSVRLILDTYYLIELDIPNNDIFKKIKQENLDITTLSFTDDIDFLILEKTVENI